MIYDIARQAFAGIDAFLQLVVGDDHRTGERPAGCGRMLGELGADYRHGLVKVDANNHRAVERADAAADFSIERLQRGRPDVPLQLWGRSAAGQKPLQAPGETRRAKASLANPTYTD